MHTRVAVFAALVLFGLGCHRHARAPTAARSGVGQPVHQQHTTTTYGVAGTPGDVRPAPAAAPTNVPAVPPPAAGTSSPMQNTEPFKPGQSAQPPSPVGGGPKPETGGAVFGDGNEGNTGAPKGGDGSAPGK